MAVESSHLNLLHPQFLQDRQILMNSSNEGHRIDVYNQQQMRFPEIPFPATLPGNESFYHQQPKTWMNNESGITCNNIPLSRKRSRDELFACMPSSSVQKRKVVVYGGSHIQIQPYQSSEIDAIICEHTKKIILELQQRQKQNAKLLVAAIGESMIKALRERDEEIEKMGRLNVMLQEKVKGLYIENNLWRELAETNEATANSLHTDLQHALAQYGGVVATPTHQQEAESCGSNDHDQDEGRLDTDSGDNKRLCRNCGERQCSVLLLPCRHLCLCNLCVSGGSYQLRSCPVCNSSMTATLHVNIS